MLFSEKLITSFSCWCNKNVLIEFQQHFATSPLLRQQCPDSTLLKRSPDTFPVPMGLCMAQQISIALERKNRTDISAVSATFCTSGCCRKRQLSQDPTAQISTGSIGSTGSKQQLNQNHCIVLPTALENKAKQPIDSYGLIHDHLLLSKASNLSTVDVLDSLLAEEEINIILVLKHLHKVGR